MWHQVLLSRYKDDVLERIGLHGLTGEEPEELSDEEHAEIELQKLRAFKSRMKSMGVVEVIPAPAN